MHPLIWRATPNLSVHTSSAPLPSACVNMHRALEIHDILYLIFLHCAPPEELIVVEHAAAHRNLAALARTCRAFKEPALDVKWMTLAEMSPLACCLPEASHPESRLVYTFTRPLTLSEWSTLRDYTRRIRVIHCFQHGLDAKAFAILSNPPTTHPLFPTLQSLRNCRYTQHTKSLLHQPLPSLRNLKVTFATLDLFQDSLKSFPMFSPNIRNLFIDTEYDNVVSMEPDYIRRWKNLCVLCCPGVTLDMASLEHLSRMPALTRLRFPLNAILPASDSLSFPNLQELMLSSESLDPISGLLSQTRLPAITAFYASVNRCPSSQELSSFWRALLTSNVAYTIERLSVHQPYGLSHAGARSFLLGLEDLRPCMEFKNLRRIILNFHSNCSVGLTDLLPLASAWPKLEQLSINQGGWDSQGGITPGELIRLLQACPALERIDVCLDTRGYTEVPPNLGAETLGLARRSTLMIDVLDAAIEEHSMLPLAFLFATIATCCDTLLSLSSWRCPTRVDVPDWNTYSRRWDIVRDRMSRPHLLVLPTSPSASH